jgi:hypothetical protein
VNHVASNGTLLMPVPIELTATQREELKPFLEAARAARQFGRPGMVIAQVFDGKMKVGFIRHAQALALLEALGLNVNIREG